MKKIIIISTIIIALLVGFLIAVPLFFKQPLLEKIKTLINKNINAEVEFSDLKLNLFRNFPTLTMELTDVMVKGRDDFQNDTLFAVPSLRANTPLGQLFNMDNLSIKEISMHEPHLKLVVADSGQVNWDIALETGTETDITSPGDGFTLKLDEIIISDAGFIYEDREADMLLLLEDIDINIAGKLYGTAAQVLAEGMAEQLSFTYGNINYISKVAVKTTSLLDVDYDKMDIRIEESQLLVNRLPMEVTGLIQIPDDSMFFDLQFKTKESGFDNFLALVPPGYEDYLKNIKTRGNAILEGTVNGLYYEEIYPAFNINIDVTDGNFHYADLPEEIKNIYADISVHKPQGILDLTEVKISKAHAEVKNSPVDLSLNLKNPVSDLYFNGAFKGNVNLNDWKDALPLDSVNIAGLINADIVVTGNYSMVENKEYDRIKSEGAVLLSNFIYESSELTQKIYIPEGTLDFTPRALNLNGLNVKIGQSDIRLWGNVLNYLDYIFKGETLAANLNLSSSLLNVNELLRLQIKNEISGQTVADSTDTDEKLVFDIPRNINFKFQSDINRVIFEKMSVNDVNGLITAQNGKLVLDGLNMRILDGELQLSGSYENTPDNKPLFDLGLNILKVDIPQAFKTLTSIQKMIPIAGSSVGKFNSEMKVKGQFSPDFKLLSSAIDGSGRFSTESLSINESPVFEKLKGILKSEKLKNIKVSDFDAYVEIEQGGIRLKPFTTNVSGQEATISGTLNTENLLDMKLDFIVEREAFGPDIENILKMLPGEERIQLLPASVVLKGPVGNPEVSVNLEEARKQITEEVKKSAKEDIQKSLNKIGEGLRKIIK